MGITTEEILKLEGIVIRLIPKTTTLRYDAVHFSNKPNQKLFYNEKNQKNMVKK